MMTIAINKDRRKMLKTKILEMRIDKEQQETKIRKQ